MVTTKTPQKKAEQKMRTERNKQKAPKKRQFRDPEIRKQKKLLNKKLRKNEKS